MSETAAAHPASCGVFFKNEQNIEECINSLNNAEAILLHPASSDPIFERVCDRIDKKKPIVSFGLDPSLWSFSTIPARIVSTANAYVVYVGEELRQYVPLYYKF